MTTMNISIPDEMKAFIENQLAQEGFASASEYFRSLVREAQRRKAKQELEAKLLEGLQGDEKGDILIKSNQNVLFLPRCTAARQPPRRRL